MFTGPIKMAYEKGIPLNCSWKAPDGTDVEGQIKGKKYKGVISKNGKEMNIIMKNSCMWMWNEEENKGFKSCFEQDPWEMKPSDVETPEGTGIQVKPQFPEKVTCRPGLFSDSVFNLPSGIDFIDLNSMQNPM